MPNLTREQYRALRYLAEHGSTHRTAIAADLSLSTHSTPIWLGRLVGLGLVRRAGTKHVYRHHEITTAGEIWLRCLHQGRRYAA